VGEAAAFTHLTRDPSLAERVGVALMDTITSGRPAPGDRLPSERDGGEQFGVSRTAAMAAETDVELDSLTAGDVVAARSAMADHLAGSRPFHGRGVTA
jgi:DNA-binding FadR family transcriptional regulator